MKMGNKSSIYLSNEAFSQLHDSIIKATSTVHVHITYMNLIEPTQCAFVLNKEACSKVQISL